ncbi:hypothetical protein [Microbacterium sp.]|uniref:hypothetical protein n=1 Tax=Microbacterium sp. TaxID=51671 RepID=UPI003F6F6F88
MESAELHAFISHTEGTVSPKAVGALHGRAEMLARMPMRLQRWIVAHAKGEEYMGFVVEPYCLFLAYEIRDQAAAERQLPPGYRLIPSSMFDDEQPRYIGIVGAFSVHTSVFWGGRVELYVIAENTRTGMLTWVICDYESNTINYDPGGGFSAATTERAVITTSHRGDVVVDVRSRERANHLAVTASVPAGERRALDQRLWIEGNLSVDYGGRLLSPGEEPFGLIFDPDEMREAIRIPLDAVELRVNTFGAAFLDEVPFEVACFPYAQHFLTTSYPRPTSIRDRDDLDAAVRGFIAAD